MKSCGNCRRVWADDYNGQCTDCGAPMAGAQVNGSNDLAMRFANQRRMADREASFEGILRAGGHKDINVDSNVLEVAKGLLTPKPGAFDGDE